jgi:uncharacterized membrane protein
MMEKWIRVYEVLAGNKRLFGTVIGVIFGLFFLIFGFLKTVAFALFVFAGYYLGKMWEEKEDWRDVIDRIMPQNFRE